MPALIDARPAGIDLLFRPGTTLTVTMTWPAGSLAGRTFSATLNGSPISVGVVGNTMTVEATDVQTAALTAAADWVLLENIGGTNEPIMVGTWAPSDDASAVSSASVNVTQGASEVEVSVNGATVTTALSSLTAATTPLGGDELVPGLQDGVAVKITADVLAGGPVETFAGVNRGRVRWFDDFEGFTTAVTTNTTLIGDTKMRTALSGTGAQAQQAQALGEFGIARLATGTATNGRCAIEPNYALLLLFGNTDRYAIGVRMRMPAVSDGTNTYVVTAGIGDMSSSAPPNGFIFRSPTAAGNWQAVVRSASADADVTDTGVAVDSGGAFHTFVVEYAPTFGARWWIDGALVASEAVNLPAALANLSSWGCGIFKSAGTTSRTLDVDALSWDMPGGARLALMP
jgi:hypothetical protein